MLDNGREVVINVLIINLGEGGILGGPRLAHIDKQPQILSGFKTGVYVSHRLSSCMFSGLSGALLFSVT